MLAKFVLLQSIKLFVLKNFHHSYTLDFKLLIIIIFIFLELILILIFNFY
jgi:hypothetical protein